MPVYVMRSVGILSVAKIGLLFGFSWGIFYALIAATGLDRFAPGTGAFSSITLPIIMPVFGAVAGFLVGAVHAVLYNVFAGWVGGIRQEYQET